MLGKQILGGFLATAAAGSALALAPSALALQQPDGTPIPQFNRLQTVLTNAGEPIDPVTEAAVTPETFTPSCALTFTLIARGAPGDPSGLRTSFGWYNVTGSKPANSELVEFLTCNDAPGTSRVLDIRSDPKYLGGEVGFFQATPQGTGGNCVDFNNLGSTLGYVYYSQRQYNPDNVGANSTIHLLIMDSKVLPDAFYFAWEDLFSAADIDNDFEDFVTRVEGIQCSGGGDPCDTGLDGICAAGTQQCVNGGLQCVQNQQPGTETCNALDDDCNGQTDEGDLCPTNEVCDRGKCVPKCGTGEFACDPTLVCNSAGLCVDPACETVTCDAGQICVRGTCQAPCDGVTCPYGQVCRGGECVDPCQGVQCDSDYACHLGVCTLSCNCSGCDTGKVCDQTSLLCIDSGCESQSCGAGTHCEGGSCVDDCTGAVCPAGQVCEAGQCVEGQSPDGGAAGAGTGGGFPFDGGFGANPGTGGTGGSGATSTGGGVSRGGSTPESDSGCGCRVAGGQVGSFAALLGLLLAAAAVARRRRR